MNSFSDKQNVLLVAHGAILYAILAAITDGLVEYGGNKVRFDQGSVHLIKYFEGTIEVARYNEDNRMFMGIGKYFYEKSKKEMRGV